MAKTHDQVQVHSKVQGRVCLQPRGQRTFAEKEAAPKPLGVSELLAFGSMPRQLLKPANGFICLPHPVTGGENRAACSVRFVNIRAELIDGGREFSRSYQ